MTRSRPDEELPLVVRRPRFFHADCRVPWSPSMPNPCDLSNSARGSVDHALDLAAIGRVEC